MHYVKGHCVVVQNILLLIISAILAFRIVKYASEAAKQFIIIALLHVVISCQCCLIARLITVTICTKIIAVFCPSLNSTIQK